MFIPEWGARSGNLLPGQRVPPGVFAAVQALCSNRGRFRAGCCAAVASEKRVTEKNVRALFQNAPGSAYTSAP
ncbi:hypothetical protein DB347_11780 [Opitutaceae bacterium EW11]|nr:hypothetical protein DB347_11780 [Opitutaceae bacterium EW11]